MVLNNAAYPAYGGRLRTPEFYEQLNRVINILRGRVTLATVAQHLQAQKFQTPSGKEWTKDRLAAYLKSNAYKGI